MQLATMPNTTGNRPEQERPDPVFVLCGARSGSTLLRLILDAHPSLSCPSETNAVNIAAAFLQSHNVRHGPAKEPGDRALAHVRELILDLMGPATPGVIRCDKSLNNWEYSGLLRRLWPAGQFICLHRHIMDFIASAIEACPWGFNGYGFAPYVSASPNNFVVALARYWIDRTRHMIDLETESPELTCSIRYEDLVAHPDLIVKELWHFLGVKDWRLPVDQLFTSRIERGAGDFKVWFTDHISDGSVGRGTTVPVSMLPEPMREEVNKLLIALEYATVDADWGSYRRIAGSAPIPHVEPEPSRTPLGIEDRATSVARPVITERDGAADPDPLIEWLEEKDAFSCLSATGTLRLVISDGATVILNRDLVVTAGNPTSLGNDMDGDRVGDHSGGPQLVVSRTALLQLLTGTLTVSSAVRRGEVRYYGSAGSPPSEDAEESENLFVELQTTLTRLGQDAVRGITRSAHEVELAS